MLQQFRRLLELTRKSNGDLSYELRITVEGVTGSRPLAGRGSRCLPVLQPSSDYKVIGISTAFVK